MELAARYPARACRDTLGLPRDSRPTATIRSCLLARSGLSSPSRDGSPVATSSKVGCLAARRLVGYPEGSSLTAEARPA